jgi:hypothetical protein
VFPSVKEERAVHDCVVHGAEAASRRCLPGQRHLALST